MIGRRFQAGRPERAIDSLDDIPSRIGDDELVWVDLEREDPAIPEVLERLGITIVAERLASASARPELIRVDGVVVVSMTGLAADAPTPRPLSLDIVAGHNAVVSVRDGAVAGLDDVATIVRGSSRLGELDAASFVAVLMDGVVGAYFSAVEEVERRIDAIDDRALRARADASVLPTVVAIRREIATLRRSLAPHRGVVAALARPDLGLRGGEGNDPWPALVERTERAIEAVENARELLLGSFDLLMTLAAQRTNDIVRVLTVVSVVLLPAGVLAGLFGMNFHSPLFETDGLFVPVVLAIGGVSGGILAAARWRRWV